MIGNKHNNWTILSEPVVVKGKKYYQCKCECGSEKLIRNDQLFSNKSTSCRNCRFLSKEIKIGDVFGRWTVIQQIESQDKRKQYIVQCGCGFIKVLKGIRLRFGDSNQCRKCGSTKHNLVHSPTYRTWESMIQRCINPKNTNYKHYGARKIKIYENWLDFKNFVKDMGLRPENKELDRIDNNGNYEPNNCRWITHQENLSNRRKK